MNDSSPPTIKNDPTSVDSGLPGSGGEAVVDASEPAIPIAPLNVSPETIKHAGNALFVLWLKIAGTILAARFITVIWPVLVLLILSLMLVATFNPMVRKLQMRVKRSYAIATVIMSALLLGGGMFALMVPPLMRQARNILTNLPVYLTQMETVARKSGLKVHLSGSSLDLSQQAAKLGPETFNVLLSVFSGIMGMLTVAVLTTYLLIGGTQVSSRALGLLPRHHRLPVRRMFVEIGLQVGDYMRGQLITSVMAGVFSYVLLFVMGVPEALALGFLMAVADAIPMVGPLIGTVPAVLMALTLGSNTALIVLAGYIIYHLIESHILVPRIYGTTMKLAPAVIVVAILIGATLQGVLGALLALPVAAAIPVIFRHIQEARQREDDILEGPNQPLP